MVQAHTVEALTCLGRQRDGTGQSKTDLTETVAIVKAHCAEIGVTAASMDTMSGSSKLVTYVKARYKANLSPWSLMELEDIDKLFLSFYTKVTKKCANSHMI